MAFSADCSPEPAARAPARAVWELAWIAPLGLLLLADLVPRFYQGDSLSYLTTQLHGWMPPDRSWVFGMISHLCVVLSRGWSAFILIQVALLGVLAWQIRRLFRDGTLGSAAYGAAAFAICADPLCETYARFFMSDFLAMACFVACLLFLHGAAEAAGVGARRCSLLGAAAAGGLATVLRIAYAPICAATLVGMALLAGRRVSGGRRLGLLAVLAGPLLSLVLLMAANSVVFGTRFHHEWFVSKLSGVFLAGVFAPALAPSDFAHAGVPVTEDEFRRLDPGSYAKRLAQVWGSSDDDLHAFLERRLGVRDEYSAAVDRAAAALVASAARRDPLAVAEVYLRNGALYLAPARWRNQFVPEMGLDRPLPQDFVDFFNAVSDQKIGGAVTLVVSPLLAMYRAVVELYPAQIVAAGAASVFLLLRRRDHATVVAVSGWAAVLLAAPLYSIYVIPRYILGAVLLGWVLIFLAAAGLAECLARTHLRPAPAR